MIKVILMFVFGNALWDKLVEFFGSTEDVIFAAILLVALIVVVKFFKQIVGLAVVIFILWMLFH